MVTVDFGLLKRQSRFRKTLGKNNTQMKGVITGAKDPEVFTFAREELVI